jgi:hypothetical protein
MKENELKIPVPTNRIPLKDIYIVSTESNEVRKGLKQKLEKFWRRHLRRYKPIYIPICCEYCRYVGEPTWHCYNPRSTQYAINVSPLDVCSKWEPNLGLIMYLNRHTWRLNL